MPGRIVIIDDHKPNLELMVYLLEAFGYTTVTASDGEAGVAAALRERPDLVICDIQLPGLDGYGVIQALKARDGGWTSPVLAVTALAMVGDQGRILAAGFDGCLVKPIDPERFVEQVEVYLKGPAAVAGGPCKGASILVVDDVADNLELARSLLEPFGYEIITASGGDEALQEALRCRPDLILSDVCMRRGSGLELVRKVRAESPLAKTPFIFVTSTMVDEEDRRIGMSLGATRYLFRPIDSEELLREVQECLEEHRVVP